MTIIKQILIYFYLIFFLACNNIIPLNKIYLLKGEDNLFQQVKKLKTVKGILPEKLLHGYFLNKNKSQVLRINKNEFFEYFLFDKNYLILILSKSPLYFVVLETSLLQPKFSREFEQLKSDIHSSNKKQIQNPFFKKIGFSRVEAYFTPKEFNFSKIKSSNKLGQMRQVNRAIRPRPDLWRLLFSAQDAILYFPRCEDEKLAKELKLQISEGKTRRVFCREIMWPDSNFGIKVSVDLSFPIILGSKLRINDHLLDGVNLPFYNENNLKEDFVAFFSLNPGNPLARVEEKDFLNRHDGVVLIIRGKIDWVKNFLVSENLPLSQKLDTYYSLEYVQKVGPNKLSLTFSEKTIEILKLMICEGKIKPFLCKEIDKTQISKTSDKQFLINLSYPINPKKYYSIFAIGRNTNHKLTNFPWKDLHGLAVVTKINVSGHNDLLELLVTQSGNLTGTMISIRKGKGVKQLLRFPHSSLLAGTTIIINAQYKNFSPAYSEWKSKKDIIKIYTRKSSSITSKDNFIWVKDPFDKTIDFVVWGNPNNLNNVIFKITTEAVALNQWKIFGDKIMGNDIIDQELDDDGRCFLRLEINNTIMDTNSSEDWLGGDC